MQSILDTSEDFLIASTGIVLSMKLLLSDTYRLVHLQVKYFFTYSFAYSNVFQNHCLEKFDSPASVKKIKVDALYDCIVVVMYLFRCKDVCDAFVSIVTCLCQYQILRYCVQQPIHGKDYQSHFF